LRTGEGKEGSQTLPKDRVSPASCVSVTFVDDKVVGTSRSRSKTIVVNDVFITRAQVVENVRIPSVIWAPGVTRKVDDDEGGYAHNPTTLTIDSTGAVPRGTRRGTKGDLVERKARATSNRSTLHTAQRKTNIATSETNNSSTHLSEGDDEGVRKKSVRFLQRERSDSTQDDVMSGVDPKRVHVM